MLPRVIEERVAVDERVPFRWWKRLLSMDWPMSSTPVLSRAALEVGGEDLDSCTEDNQSAHWAERGQGSRWKGERWVLLGVVY